MDTEQIYCRRLGHFLSFKYCRAEKQGLPCAKIIDCWQDKIPIQDFINENYSKEETAYLFEPPPPKITSLLEIIKRAQDNVPVDVEEHSK